MTTTQLSNYGIALNSWVDLSAMIKHGFLMSNEGYIFTSPTTLFYFESSSNLVFVRYVGVSGGIDDSKIGNYHCVYSIKDITMIF